jgi:alpha-tubulin suppressor-like RCC1 family protein
MNDGTVYSFGSNSVRFLRIQFFSMVNLVWATQLINSFNGAVQCTAGDYHTIILMANGSVVSFGYNFVIETYS